MKKLTFMAALLVLLAAPLALTGCLSTSSESSGSSGSTTVTLYDNCPANNYGAQSALLIVRAANPNYTGTTTFTYTGTPSASSIKPVLSYYATCETIAKGIREANGKCTLTFNTKADNSGQVLDFSTTNKAIASLALMSLNSYTSVYAIYTF